MAVSVTGIVILAEVKKWPMNYILKGNKRDWLETCPRFKGGKYREHCEHVYSVFVIKFGK